MNQPFSIEEIEVAPPKAKEVRVKVRKGFGTHKPETWSHLHIESHCCEAGCLLDCYVFTILSVEGYRGLHWGASPLKPLGIQKESYNKWKRTRRGLRVNKSTHIRRFFMSQVFSYVLPTLFIVSQWSILIFPNPHSLYIHTDITNNS